MTFDQMIAQVPLQRALRHTFADQALGFAELESLLKVYVDSMSFC